MNVKKQKKTQKLGVILCFLCVFRKISIDYRSKPVYPVRTNSLIS